MKPKLNGCLPPPTPTRASIMGLPHTPAYRRKNLQDAKQSEGISSVHCNPNQTFHCSLYSVATGFICGMKSSVQHVFPVRTH